VAAARVMRGRAVNGGGDGGACFEGCFRGYFDGVEVLFRWLFCAAKVQFW